MKILIADKDKTICLHLPLTLLCSHVGAALIAGGIRRTTRLSDSVTALTVQRGLVTTSQVYGLLKVLRQSKRLLRRSGLPLLDVQEGDGCRIMIVL